MQTHSQQSFLFTSELSKKMIAPESETHVLAGNIWYTYGGDDEQLEEEPVGSPGRMCHARLQCGS